MNTNPHKHQKTISLSERQTKKVAYQLAQTLTGGEVLGLVGELGSGKTQFVKGLAKYFGIKQEITSPTFVLLRPYATACPEESRRGTSRGDEGSRGKCKGAIKKLIHIDCYRLDNPEELLTIGLNEYLENKNCVTVIEWADKIENILPRNTIWIKFKMGKKENERIINFE